MKFRNTFPVIVAALFVLSPAIKLVAQTLAPAVSGVSGTLSHGSTVTVAGSNFGSKPTAAPVKYDDFQSVPQGSGIAATSTAGGATWRNQTTDQQFPPIASNRRLRSGTPFTVNMTSHWQQPQGGGGGVSNVYLVGQSFVKLYFDAWMYYDAAGQTSPTQNIKPFRLHQLNAGSPNAYVNIYAPSTGGAAACGRDGVTRSDSDWAGGGVTSATFYNRWVHVQWIIDAGAGNNTSTGSCILYINGALVYNHTSVPTIGSGYYSWPELYVGNYIRTGDWSGETFTQWESLYIDNSWARVEIGDNAIYNNCTHREIQVPNSWSNGSIGVRLNRGSFASLNGLYLFVVNANGTASAGYPLNGTGGPSTPTNLRITPP